jgi:hypothetical protein
MASDREANRRRRERRRDPIRRAQTDFVELARLRRKKDETPADMAEYRAFLAAKKGHPQPEGSGQ